MGKSGELVKLTAVHRNTLPTCTPAEKELITPNKSKINSYSNKTCSERSCEYAIDSPSNDNELRD